MTRRNGMTLVEVLVAIFIMAVGLLALLTLFPLGILRIAQALRDERTTQSALNAQAISIVQDIRNDPLVMSDIPTGGTNPDFFANPLPGTLSPADPYGESYPIFVDPIGYNGTPAGPAQDWIGGVPPAFGGTIRRRPVQFTTIPPGTNPQNIYKNFTLWDDIAFNGTLDLDPTLPLPGTPQLVGLTVLRETRFSWAYLLRRPQTSDRSIVDCSIVVFDQRPLALTGQLQLEENVYPNTSYFNPTNNTIAIDYTNRVPPPLRAGDWILDSSLNDSTGNTTLNTTPSAHAYFYRVVATEELVVAGRTIARYEVQNPIRAFKDPAKVAMTDPQFGYKGTAIVIRGIAEVFEKGPVRLP